MTERAELSLVQVDSFVQEEIAATNGRLYRPLIHRLKRYPIPELRLPAGGGKSFLDIGCNWGRWTIAAARAGYRPVGIDPSEQAIDAARRVSGQLNIEAQFLAADARRLPFSDHSFDVVFSYSVFQHFEKSEVLLCLGEISRVLKRSGTSLIQMPNLLAPRNLFHRARRGFRKARDFEVRYWTPAELKRVFSEHIGPTRLEVDGFFSLNPQTADKDILPFGYRRLVGLSDKLRRVASRLIFLAAGADSLYVHSRKSPEAEA